MSWGGPEFVLAIIAISTLGWIVTSWIRAKHGYPVEGEWGGLVHQKGDEQRLRAVTDENAALKTQIKRLEERLHVLERIATDPAERTAREIENLR